MTYSAQTLRLLCLALRGICDLMLNLDFLCSTKCEQEVRAAIWMHHIWCWPLWLLFDSQFHRGHRSNDCWWRRPCFTLARQLQLDCGQHPSKISWYGIWVAFRGRCCWMRHHFLLLCHCRQAPLSNNLL